MSEPKTPGVPFRPAPFAYLFERFPSFVQTFVYREAVEMIRQGMEPLCLSIRQPDDPADLAEHLGAEVFYLPPEKELRAEVDRRRADGSLTGPARKALPRHRSDPDSQRLFEAAWLGPALKKAGIRHIHAHFGGMAARTAWWLKKLYGIPYSFTGHANDIFCDNDFPVSNAALAEAAAFVVTETDYARRWMEEKYPRLRGRAHRVFNGIDVDGFPPRAPVDGPHQILSVGRCVEKKGFRHLIEACRILHSEGLAFRCLIAGGGPLEAELQAQIDRAALGSCVTLLGPRPQAEIRRLLAASSIFALACVPEAGGGSDNLPTVVMEAMVCGIPTVSTRLAGVPEMITDGVDGLLAPPGDAIALAAALRRLLQDAEFGGRLATAGQVSAREKFAVSTTTAQLKRLLVERAGIPIPEAARAFAPELRRPPLWRRAIQALSRG